MCVAGDSLCIPANQAQQLCPTLQDPGCVDCLCGSLTATGGTCSSASDPPAPPRPHPRPQGCVLVTLVNLSSFLLLPPSRNTRLGGALRGPLNTVTRHLWCANTQVQSAFSLFLKHTHTRGPRLLCPGWRGVNWRRVKLTTVAQSGGRK